MKELKKGLTAIATMSTLDGSQIERDGQRLPPLVRFVLSRAHLSNRFPSYQERQGSEAIKF